MKKYKNQKNVLLVLTTNGGDPHAAYRMARCLQQHYETVAEGIGTPSQRGAKGKFTVFVDTRCKSAGTILAAGANILIFSDYGELGPIDVQLRKMDEVGERSSVLTPRHAMEALQALALQHFEKSFTELRFSEELSFTTKLAAEVARGMAVGLFEPIFGQIDPMRVGEYDRAMRISNEYASRLGKSNLREGALKRLVEGYPAHGFVIDKEEAKELFDQVEEPTEELVQLGEVCRAWWGEYLGKDAPLILYLTSPPNVNPDPGGKNDGNTGNAGQNSPSGEQSGGEERTGENQGGTPDATPQAG